VTGPWREPDAETNEYPNLWVHDGRVSGSITVGPSRLPLWSFVGWVPTLGWDEVVKSWPYIEDEYGWTADRMGEFLHYLMEQRGEFARLLLVLADAERCEHVRGQWDKPWWQTKVHRKRVRKQLQRCLDVLGEE
jgi:hypothetical protein